MLSMKQAGPLEIARVKTRALKSLAMRRISATDCEYIVTRCDEIEARIVAMTEYPEEE